MKPSLGFILLLLILLPGFLKSAGPGLEGKWTFVPGRSTDIASWGNTRPQIDISTSDGNVRVIHSWLDRGNVAYADTFEFRPGGEAVTSTTRSEIWPENWFMGVLSSPGDPRTVSGLWLEAGSSLRVVTGQTLRTSQGKTAMTTIRNYTLGADGKTMTVSEKRTSRPSPVVLLFERKEPPPK